MKLKTIMLMTGAVAMAGTAFAASHGNMSNSMTLVSWGGAYQKSQINAYSDPYKAMNEGLEVVWDESTAEAVAKLRAMNEAGNITWDLVDVVAADAIRLCDEGLAMEIDPDEDLAAAPDGTPASEDFGDLSGQRLLHSADRLFDDLRLSHRPGRRHAADRHLRGVRPGSISGQARAGKAPDQQHGMGAALRRRRQGRRL